MGQDEPFSALDSHLRVRLQMELRDTLRQYSGTTLMVTHSRAEAYHMCGAITVADDGIFAAPRPTKALFADPESFAAAQLTGCKNIAKARKTGEYEVQVPAWNVRFTTACPVRDDLAGVAFRAHYVNPRTVKNQYPVTFVGELEEPFEWVLLYRYYGQDTGQEPLWWRLPKDKRPQVLPQSLGLAPANVLLLYR